MWKSNLTLCDPIDYTVHEVLQDRILEWVAFPVSRGPSQLRDWTQVSLYCRQILYQMSHKGSPRILAWVAYHFSSRSSQPRNQTRVSCIAGGFLIHWAVREASTLLWWQANTVPLSECFINSRICFLCSVTFLCQRTLQLGWSHMIIYQDGSNLCLLTWHNVYSALLSSQKYLGLNNKLCVC